ncbi:alkaline phosphatase [Sedimentisphaera salicampi]|uniref:alkaline phosphatase n=1 Tax=Sedimentisphaera salicampi TaxID=1941349 RepID=UPI000B9AED52|nr:alkaline phosphatase [Sedimentisphaera salicampi]OXU14888.1 Alkaline phosphatase 4 precursor [Sedimentisphaera salicampi]
MNLIKKSLMLLVAAGAAVFAASTPSSAYKAEADTNKDGVVNNQDLSEMASSWLGEDEGPKYVFCFIGDGMASPHIHATEAYLKQKVQADDPDGDLGAGSLGTAGSELLTMSQLPVMGMQRTYADNRFITGSAAAATAFSCGHKTNINTISMDPEHTMDYVTIAEAAKDKGMKVGIVSSVSIDHATPACYYAHNEHRGNYWDIANQLSESGFDYFGGGGMKGERTSGGNRKYAPGQPAADASNCPIQHAMDNGYTVCENKAELEAAAPGQKVFAYSKDYIDGSWALPYNIDRDPADASIADYTSEGIRLLDNENGFFMMVEAGKIDWACHANDAVTAIKDTIAFDEAVAQAYDFYLDHPEETLIVVTGDHDCGGMTLGAAGTGYNTYYEVFENQTMSCDAFVAGPLADHKAAYGQDPWNNAIDMNQDIKDKIENAFGLDYDAVSDFDRTQLENAYDETMGGNAVPDNNENWQLYGYYDPLRVTVTHIMNRNAGLAWTSYSHTAVPVPVMAVGSGQWKFDGYYENTAIADKIADIMQVSLEEAAQ